LKDAGPDQEVYLFVIQGMKERMKSDFFNKRQQQVEDTQRQQQQIAQEENYIKQLTFGQQVSSNRDQLDTLPRNDPNIPYQQEQQPSYNTQQPPPHDAQYQRHFQDQNHPTHPRVDGPGYYQDQQRPLIQARQQHPQSQQPVFQHQAFQPPIEQPRVPSPRNDFVTQPPPQRNDFNIPQVEPRGYPQARPEPVRPVARLPEQPDIFAPPNIQPRGVVPGGVPVLPMAPIQKRPANEGPPQMAPKSLGQAEKPSGWNCPKCTYLNEPYRPGCKMCSAERPENYEVPVGHVASADELRFINEVHQ